MNILTANQMRALDSTAIEQMGIPGIVLMENAALQVLRVLREKVPCLKDKKIGVFAGKGNNGGDGFALSRHLKNLGAHVTVYLLARKESLSGDAQINMESCHKMGISILEITSEEGFDRAKIGVRHQAVLIDAILGTGTSKPARGLFEYVISFLNTLSLFTLAIDIPSGLSSDTGSLSGVHIKADVTVALGSLKLCHVLSPAAQSCGSLEVVDIGIPKSVSDNAPCDTTLITKEFVQSQLRPRESETHKGTYGHLLAVAGSVGKGGAAALSSLAALRVGAGLVTLAVPSSLASSFETGVLEVMTLSVSETDEGTFAANAEEGVMAALQDKDVLLIGPGITTNKETGRFVKNVLLNTDLPVVLDADGLNILSDEMDILKKRRAPTILTPHPGEMARLCGTTTQEIQSDRLSHAREAAQKWGVSLVLKGAGTIVCTPDGKAAINRTGNPGMASAGTGDILAGMIAGFLSQGMAPEKAAQVGVYLHGLSGDIASKKYGERSLTASDLMASLPESILQTTTKC